MGRLAGKVAWISGATSGIGEATARLFAQEGAKVVLIGRRLAMSRQIAAELRAGGAEVLPIACDVSGERPVRDSIRQTVERFGSLDILVNNAGMVHVKLLHEYTETEWDRVMAVNVKSMFFATKHALPHLRRAGRSYIVNVGSISSFVGQAHTPVYTTTKHAIVGLTKSIALDYAVDGVRCNCVCPGITDTPMLREHLNVHPDPEAALAARLRRVPMGVPLTPHDVAKTILFLSCEDSSGITGTTMIIDAGYLTAAEWDTKGRTAFMAGSNKTRVRSLPVTFQENRQSKEQMMKLKFACADFTFPLLQHDRVLDLIAMLDFDGVDIGLFEGRSHLWPSRVFKSPAKSGAQLGRKLAERGVRGADVFLQMDPGFVPYAINHPEEARRRHARGWFLKTLDYAVACGAKHVTTLPGVYFEDEKPADSWQRCCDELAWRVEQAKQARIRFSIEAHVGSIVPKPKAALRLVNSVPGLTLTLDYTHFTRCGMPDSAVEPLLKHASHFHARGARQGRLQASFQQNTIDYARVLRAMRKAKYQGYVGVEYVWIDWEHCNEVDNLSETIQLRDFLRAKMAAV